MIPHPTPDTEPPAPHSTMPRAVPSPHGLPRSPFTELHKAACYGAVDLIAAILSQGSIEVNQADFSGFTPLIYSAKHGRSRAAKFLLHKGARATAVADEGTTALHIAAHRGHPEVVELLIKAGADIEAVDSDGATPLYLGVYAENLEVMRLLVDAGANPDVRLSNGDTPLFRAVARGHVVAIRELARANVNASMGSVGNGVTCLALDVAAQHGTVEVVAELLDRFGIEGCTGENRGARTLKVAAHDNRVDVMMKLLDAGAVGTGDALMMAAQNGCVVPVKLLLQLGQRREKVDGIDVETQLMGGVLGRALVISLTYCPPNTPRVVRLLVDAGVDTSYAFPNTAGLSLTPMDLVRHVLDTKSIGGKPATEEELGRLEAVRRLFLQEEAIHATSWLWLSNANSVVRPTSQDKAERTSTASTAATLPIIWRRRRVGALLPAVFRHSKKP